MDRKQQKLTDLPLATRPTKGRVKRKARSSIHSQPTCAQLVHCTHCRSRLFARRQASALFRGSSTKPEARRRTNLINTAGSESHRRTCGVNDRPCSETKRAGTDFKERENNGTMATAKFGDAMGCFMCADVLLDFKRALRREALYYGIVEVKLYAPKQQPRLRGAPLWMRVRLPVVRIFPCAKNVHHANAF